MTPLSRPLARVTKASLHSQGRARSIVVELSPATPTLIGFRLKGTRRTYYLPIDHLFREACRNELARQKQERKRAAAERRKARGGR